MASTCETCGAAANDGRCSDYYCPSRLAARRSFAWRRALLVIIAGVALGLLWGLGLVALERDCRARGGHLAVVYGGYRGFGSYVCIAPEETP